MNSDELLEYLHGAVVLAVGTRDEKLRPDVAWGMGVKAAPGAKSLTIYIPDNENEQTLKNIASNGAIAVTVGEPVTHKTVQIKGTVTAHRPTDSAEQGIQEIYRSKITAMLDQVGIGGKHARYRRLTPSTAVEFSVEQIFDQTPGPGAGEPLELTDS